MVLVTGAGGFVGSAIVRLLVKSMREVRPSFSDGVPVDHVVALVRPGGSTDRLNELARTGDWSIQHGDLTDHEGLERVLGDVQPRVIVHTALDANAYSDLTEGEHLRLNILPLETLFDGLRGTRGSRFVHTGSAWVLPPGDRIDETVKAQPRSEYAQRKARADEWVQMLGRRTGVPWINLRLFNIFGKYEKRSRLLPYMVSQLTEGKEASLSHGNQIRDFNDVDDMAGAYVLALAAPDEACGRVYHIGSGRGTTARDFAMTVAKFTGNPHLVRFEANRTPDQDLPSLVADPTLAQRILGWTPVTDLECRIRRAVEWWLDLRSIDRKVVPRPGVDS